MIRLRHLLWGLLLLGLNPAAQAVETPGHACPAGNAAVKAFILKESLKSRIVMFGGRHGTFRADNDFLTDLLPELRRQGYTYLAVEFEKNPRKDSLHEAIQDYAKGAICREDMLPMWLGRERIDCAGTFDLIDTARRLGMQVVFYDADEDAYKFWAQREEIAFKNLREQVLEADPEARIVVFCGALHLNERPHQDFSLDFRKQTPRRVAYLGCYLNRDSQDRNLTVSLLGDPVSRALVPHCDLVVDLQKQTCRRSGLSAATESPRPSSPPPRIDRSNP